MTVAESLGMGFISFIMSILVGTAFAFILIKVINLQSFNWTVFYHFTLPPYLVTALTALAASLVAARISGLVGLSKVPRSADQGGMRAVNILSLVPPRILFGPP